MGDLGLIPGSGRSSGGISHPLQDSWASLVAQTVKNLPTIWETWVRSLGREDPLEKEILLCLATMWFRPAAILLELDFLSLCLETRALRNTYLDHL